MTENKRSDIIIAGFGGQGVLLAGMILAQAALEDGKETTWFPSYGAEMRGGTANSTVIISESEIGSPVTLKPNVLIALSAQAVEKFLPKTAENSIVIVNSSLVKEKTEMPGRKFHYVPATELAEKKAGDVRAANLVLLGAFLAASGLLRLESAEKACEKAFPDKPKLVLLNKNALGLGYNFK